MLVEYFTNPVQGARLRALWNPIMGIPDKISGPRPSPRTPTKKVRVEKKKILNLTLKQIKPIPQGSDTQECVKIL